MVGDAFTSSDFGSNFGIAFGLARRRRKALLTDRAGAAKKAVKAARENMGRGAAAWRSGRSAADPKQPLRFMKCQASGCHWHQTCSACAANRPETISGGGPKTSGNLFDKSSSFSTSHFEYPPITGELRANTTRPIRVSLEENEHIGQGSTIEYKVQSCRRLRLRIFCASESATSSAWRVTSLSDETRFVVSAMTCPRETIRAPNGSSPFFAPSRATSRHRAIICKS